MVLSIGCTAHTIAWATPFSLFTIPNDSWESCWVQVSCVVRHKHTAHSMSVHLLWFGTIFAPHHTQTHHSRQLGIRAWCSHCCLFSARPYWKPKWHGVNGTATFTEYCYLLWNMCANMPQSVCVYFFNFKNVCSLRRRSQCKRKRNIAKLIRNPLWQKSKIGQNYNSSNHTHGETSVRGTDVYAKYTDIGKSTNDQIA